MERDQYLLERLDKFDEKMDKILVQTTRTNGRVNALEEKVEGHDEMLQKHNDLVNYNKGRDKVWWIVLGSIGTIAGGLLTSWIVEIVKIKFK